MKLNYEFIEGGQDVSEKRIQRIWGFRLRLIIGCGPHGRKTLKEKASTSVSHSRQNTQRRSIIFQLLGTYELKGKKMQIRFFNCKVCSSQILRLWLSEQNHMQERCSCKPLHHHPHPPCRYSCTELSSAGVVPNCLWVQQPGYTLNKSSVYRMATKFPIWFTCTFFDCARKLENQKKNPGRFIENRVSRK